MSSEGRSGGLGAVYAGTVLLSAFLLFQVQPLISKFILPWFGGSPAVWTTCMVFFQSLLFCGYAYAHFSEHFFRPLLQSLVHLSLLAAAVMLLPITPDAAWKPGTGDGDPTWRILGLLAMSVGVPYFVLSSTGPLVQAWFSRTYPGRSPYRLYALSNIGSLAALVSYPFVFEPALNTGKQAWYWSAGFVMFALLGGYGALTIRRLGRAAEIAIGDDREAFALSDTAANNTAAGDASASLGRRLLWMALPAFASIMLLATTNHVCQNVAVIPFLWVVPLSLYLLTFIISFDHERWYVRRWFALGAALATFLVAGLAEWPLELHFAYELGLYFAAMFGVCMLCHGELVRLRPSPRHLTMFYLMISAGGALGGVFVSLIAPQIFTTFFEWKLSLLGGYVLATALLLGDRNYRWFRQRPWLGIPAATLGLMGLLLAIDYQSGTGRVPLAEARNFYGEVAVIERAADDPLEHDRVMFHGSIVHGVQFMNPPKHDEPTTYYSPQSGVGRALAFYGRRPQMRVGAVGLGVGTLAAYPQPGQSMRFYEINPEVIRMANEYFTFLKNCRGQVETVLGDARLSLEQESPQRFDVLVLDAFSGDAVPSHLLTKEALEIYLRHLVDDGAIAIHITNTYLDLGPVVRALAERGGLRRARIKSGSNDSLALHDADWMLLTRNEELLGELSAVSDPAEWQASESLLWTDDHSNLFEILK